MATVADQLPIIGVVLAAGMSRRLGRPKQLLDLHGKPLVRHVTERALVSTLDTVVVVVGHAADDVTAALDGLDVRVATNAAFASGQSTSLVAGLKAAGPGADAIVMLLGDQPLIEPQVIDGLIRVRRTDRVSIAMAAYGSERGHPVLFGHEVFEELGTITGDQGAREVIRNHRDDVVLVTAKSSSVPLDVDTEEAYALLLDRHPKDAPKSLGDRSA